VLTKKQIAAVWQIYQEHGSAEDLSQRQHIAGTAVKGSASSGSKGSV